MQSSAAGVARSPSPRKLPNVEDIYPLSPMQQGMLFHSVYEKEASAYFVRFECVIKGDMKVAAFRRAWEEVMRRHTILRTAFFWKGMSQPVQVVREKLELPWMEQDWSAFSESEQEQKWQQYLDDDSRRGFDLSQAPLLRIALVRRKQDLFYFAFSRHHILMDGWCQQIVMHEVVSCYEAYRQGREPRLPSPVPYREYIQWLQKQDQKKAEVFWRTELQGFITPTRIGIEKRKAEEGASQKLQDYGIAQLLCGREMAEALDAFARVRQLTLNAVVQGAWGILLGRYAGEPDVIFGGPVSGRAASISGISTMVGVFINTLPVRVRVLADDKAIDFLKRLQFRQVAARDYEYIPLSKIQEWSDVPRGATLFNYLMSFQNYQGTASSSQQQNTGLKIEAVQSAETGNYPLVLRVTEAQLLLVCNYDRDSFRAEDIERMLGHLKVLLAGIMEAPQQQVGELSLLSSAEREQAVVEWNPAHVTYARNQCVHRLFEQQAARRAGEVAVVHEGRTMCYRELNHRANQLAHSLQKLNTGPEVRVALCLERSMELVIALLGILKAGGAYVPLDPAYPAERLAYMLEDADVPVLLTQKSMVSRLPEYMAGVRVVCLDEEWPEIERGSAENLDVEIGPENLAYVIYTSGSTGEPKGTDVPHRSIFGFLLDVKYARFDESAVQLQHSSLSWDALTLELWPALMKGGRCVLSSLSMITPEALRRYVHEQGVNTLWLTSSLFNSMVDTDVESLAGIRDLMIGGEAISVGHVKRLQEKLPGIRVVNGYGPSECTVFSTCYVIPNTLSSEAGTVPIGQPIGDRRVYVLDERMNPVPVGAKGELYVGGPGVGRGYRNRPELTAEKFVPDAFGAEAGGRLYRTGDLARWDWEGKLEFQGRADHQVKIRGFRVELGEIEAVLGRAEGVTQCAVVMREDEPGEKRLVGYVSGEGSEEQLRQYLRERLPEYMAPARVVVLEELPLTATGKVDRKALPAPEREGGGSEYVAPRNRTEEILCGIWAKLLRLERLSIHDDFFELGGDSISSIQAMGLARQAGISLTPKQIFEFPTVAALAEVAGVVADESPAVQEQPSAPGALAPLISVKPEELERWIGKGESIEDIYPLSPMQQGMLFHSQYHANPGMYCVQVACLIEGELDIAAFRQAWEETIRRHPILRTAFLWEDLSEPVQIVHKHAGLPLQMEDWSALGSAEQEHKWSAFLQEDRMRNFELQKPPLLRLALFQLGPQKHRFSWNSHHILLDGWCQQIVMGDVFRLYRAYVEHRELSLEKRPSYRGYIAWLKQEGEKKAETFWRDELEGFHSPTKLGIEVRKDGLPDDSEEYEQITLMPTPELKVRAERMARSQKVTLNTVVQGAWAILLSRYSGEKDVVYGTTVSGRSANVPGIENMVGLFINTLAARVRMNDAETVGDYLRHLHAQQVKARQYEYSPLIKVQGWSEVPKGTRLFDYLTVFENFPLDSDVVSSPGKARISNLQHFSFNNYPLTLEVDPGTTLNLLSSYSRRWFDKADVEKLLERFVTVIDEINAGADRRLGELSLLRPEEKSQILALSNRGAFDAPQYCVHQAFEQQVNKTPAAPAVTCNGRSLSYAELNQRANQLAHYLCSLGVGPEKLVAISLERSIEMMVAILGVLKAGGAYVPLDPDYPAERLAYIEESTQAPVLLTSKRLTTRLKVSCDLVIAVDEAWRHISAYPETNPLSLAGPENLAYVIFTSGSTGKPKGVCLTHLGACNLAAAQRHVFAVGPNRSVLQFASLNFDASVWEWLMALLSGARLVLLDEQTLLPGPEFVDLLKRESVTVATLPPSVVAMIPEADLPALQCLIVAGEACSLALMEKWATGRKMWNAYGPTETTVCATVSDPLSPGAGTPIGKPILNTQVYVLDGNLELTPLGLPGELYVGGAGLARGYLNRPELTAERFVPDPFSQPPGRRLYRTGDLVKWGERGLEFLGRMDSQIKIRGHRVELGEIEAALLEHPAIHLCTVIACEDEAADKRLVAYIVLRDSGTLVNNGEFRKFLHDKLPHYMVPSAFVAIHELPLTPSGKIDRAKLPRPAQGEIHYELLPSDELELQLSTIWQEILNVSPIGRDQSFFELGGHSLLAVRLQRRIREQFSQEIPLSVIFEYPTIQQLGKLLRQKHQPEHRSNLVAIHGRGSKQPIFFVHPGGGGALGYRHLAAALGEDQPFYAFQALNEEELKHPLSLPERAAQYIEDLRQVQPHGPYILGGWSFGGYVAYEMAQQLRRQGETNTALLLLDITAQPVASGTENEDEAETLQRAVKETTGKEFSLEAVRHLELEERLRYLANELVNARILDPDIQLSQIRDFLQGTRMRIQSALDYSLQPCSEALFLIRVHDVGPRLEGTDIDPDDHTLGFARLSAQPVRVHYVDDATHHNLVLPPQVAKVASIINKCLKHADLKSESDLKAEIVSVEGIKK